MEDRDWCPGDAGEDRKVLDYLVSYLRRESFRVVSTSGGSYSNKVTVREWMRRISG